jgi:hypothetical protein
MPPGNPSYPFGPYRFVDREYFIVIYESDADAIRRAVPEPLEPDGSHQVFYEWIAMPDSSGFGSYSESGVVIPCVLKGEPVNYTAQMYLNDEPPITADYRRSQNLGISQALGATPAQGGDRYADGHSGVRRATGRHGDDGLQTREPVRGPAGMWNGSGQDPG